MILINAWFKNDFLSMLKIKNLGEVWEDKEGVIRDIINLVNSNVIVR